MWTGWHDDVVQTARCGGYFVPNMYTGQDDTLHDDFSDGYIWVDEVPCSKAVRLCTVYVWIYIIYTKFSSWIS